ncbi:6491_t:CDS:2 [Cetraspora pellucida]|uniref:6491_t:CDS:1 n=1 Tax=Cetraspora pellucida TaxID=1433469 RepID=A0A9N9CBI8_9GLOM|nr:6491_t:CDS:2 [Cetraspora pellucida]
MPGLDFTILADIQQMLYNINPYANMFRQVGYFLNCQHRVLFKDDESLKDIVQCLAVEKTTLTAWFQANTIYPEAKNLTYTNFPSQ